ncbi:MAG: type III polyketide synthase, partial [Dehalococcoidia bacterium]|nr:type III polyketide synthase [Dehalococcoidia bacterium]
MAIRSLATAIPANELPQAEAVRMAQRICCSSEEQRQLVKVLYRRAGVEKRYTAVPAARAFDWFPDSTQAGRSHGPTTAERMEEYQQHAGPLALRAARSALSAASDSAARLRHLVTVSCTGFQAPGADLELASQLPLRSTIERTHVGFMGCHGAINGLRVARALALSQPSSAVLMCAVELCSLHYHYAWNPEMMVGNAIFGDGAAALVAEAVTDAADPAWQVANTGSCLLPDSADAMSWSVGDHGFEMRLSPRVPDLIRQHLRPWLTAWLDESGMAQSDVASWGIHPGGPRIITAAGEALDLPPTATELSRDVLRRYGNMSSPTVLFMLQELIQQNAPRP